MAIRELPHDPNPDPMIPEEIGSARRADLVVRDLDRLEAQRATPYAHADDLPPVRVKTKKPGDLEIIVKKNMITVKKADDTILVCQWLPQSDQFFLSKRMLVRGEYQKKPNDYFAELEEAWEECGQHHVRAEEFQKAFSDASPPAQWDFSNCEFGRLDCQFKYAGDNKKKGLPQLQCTVCSAVFEITKNGDMKMTDTGTDPDAAA